MLVASETVGHALVARFLDPHGERHMVLARTTQDYLEFLYAAIVVCLVLGIAVLARRAISTIRGLEPQPLPAWRVARAGLVRGWRRRGHVRGGRRR